MNYIILDLEWNQPFSRQTTLHCPFPLVGEIIQIGAVKLDEEKNILDTFKIDIAPKYYTKMHYKVKKLTGFDEKRLALGFEFPQAFQHFIQWCGENFLCFTWGHDDHSMFMDNIRLHHLDEESLFPFYNLQVFWSSQIADEKRQWGLNSALEKLNLQPDPSAHDALHDAISAAKICRYLDMAKGIQNYQDGLSLMRSAVCFQEMLSGYYPSRKDALKSPELSTCLCPTCQKPMICSTWIRQNEFKRITLTSCQDHGEYMVRVHFCHHSPKGFLINRRLYVLTQTLQQYYEEKKSAENRLSSPQNQLAKG